MSYQKLLLTAREQANARLKEKGLGPRKRKFRDTEEDSDLLSGKSISGQSLVPQRVKQDVPEEDDFMTSFYNRLYQQNQDLKDQIKTEKSVENTGGVDTSYDPLKLTEDLYGKQGVQSGKVASNSYFNTPIIAGDLRGNSRKAGDVSPEVQQEIVNRIVEYGSRMDMEDYEIAYALATARYESGFNPDASAKSTSARGLGQFINKTGEAYGITPENQWDVDTQIQALLEHTRDNFKLARNKGYSNEYVYAIHHDGPSLDKGGLAKSKKHVMPYVPKYLKLIENLRGQ